jgi:hypothetical protein
MTAAEVRSIPETATEVGAGIVPNAAQEKNAAQGKRGRAAAGLLARMLAIAAAVTAAAPRHAAGTVDTAHTVAAAAWPQSLPQPGLLVLRSLAVRVGQ